MKLLRSLLPNLSIVLNICLVVIVYLDMRNPMMGFLMGAPFQILVGSCFVTSVATAVILYADKRRAAEGKEKSVKNHE
jgi:hypothetical protein